MEQINEGEAVLGGIPEMPPSPSYGSISPLRKRAGSNRRSASRMSRIAFEDEGDAKTAIRQVTYDDRNHISVLFQMHGSVWPRVLPACLFNVALTLVVFYARKAGYDTTVAPVGHKFMGIIASFLLVQSSTIEYKRFMEARKYLSLCYKSCQELVQWMAVLTMQDSTPGAKKWRQRVAYRTIVMLRVTMAVLEFQSSGETPWEVDELDDEEKTEMREALMVSDQDGSQATGGNIPGHRVQKWAHGKRSMSDEAFRAPVVLALNLRREIMSQRRGDVLEMKWKHPCNEELKLTDFVTAFMKAFHGLKKLTTTPLPFPLVQMTRTFTFFWVFTLPFALCHKAVFVVQLCLTVFLTTYGFVGLVVVTMELADPFGEDANDFDDLGMAQMVFEDIYITLYKLDGQRSAYELRKRIVGRMNKGNALQNFRNQYGEMGLDTTLRDTTMRG